MCAATGLNNRIKTGDLFEFVIRRRSGKESIGLFQAQTDLNLAEEFDEFTADRPGQSISDIFDPAQFILWMKGQQLIMSVPSIEVEIDVSIRFAAVGSAIPTLIPE